MTRQIIVHSFHSEVPETLHELDLEPDLIVAFDSHLDVFTPLKSNVDAFPQWIRSAATRATVHGVIRRIFGDFPPMLKAQGLDVDSNPRMILVVPEVSWNITVSDQSERTIDVVKGGAVYPYQLGDPSVAYTKYLTYGLGIEPYISPPKNLMKIAEMSRSADSLLLDIDVDYLQEMQNECYTPVLGARIGQLGCLAQLAKLIHRIKPEIITVSEVTVAAAKNPESNFSKLMNQLETQGYQIEHKLGFANDEEARRLITLYEEFNKTVLKPLTQGQRMNQAFLSGEALRKNTTQINEAIKQHFPQESKGSK